MPLLKLYSPEATTCQTPHVISRKLSQGGDSYARVHRPESSSGPTDSTRSRLCPGQVTINPDQTSIEFSVDGVTLSAPVIAAAMDAIFSPAFAVEFDQLGGLAVMNLEGVQSKYDDP